MSEKKRSIFLDIARGVGIILVVIGHTMSPVMTGNAVMEAAYQILYVFHMPLFFFLAGLVAQNLIGGGYTSSRSELIKRRATRLMIPYFTWGGHLYADENADEGTGSVPIRLFSLDTIDWQQSRWAAVVFICSFSFSQLFRFCLSMRET